MPVFVRGYLPLVNVSSMNFQFDITICDFKIGKILSKDFCFNWSFEKSNNLMSQIATSSWGGRRKPPFVFTALGIAMRSVEFENWRCQFSTSNLSNYNTVMSFISSNPEVVAICDNLLGRLNKFIKKEPVAFCDQLLKPLL